MEAWRERVVWGEAELLANAVGYWGVGRVIDLASPATTRRTPSSPCSCSHTRTTVQPADSSAAVSARSLSALRPSFSFQYSVLRPPGTRPCSAQPCQIAAVHKHGYDAVA